MDAKSQNSLVQKASNIMLTGEDSVSFQKVLGKLNKRQTEEIGTLKSPTKPLYLVKQQVEELKLKKKELEALLPQKYEIAEEIKNIQKEAKEEEDILGVLQEMEKLKNISKLEEEKINIHTKAKEELEKNKRELESELDTIQLVKDTKKSTNTLYIIPCIFVIVSILLFVFVNEIFALIGLGVSVLSFIITLTKNLRQNKKYEKNQEEINKKRRDIEQKKELIEAEINTKERLIKEVKSGLEVDIRLKKDQISLMYPNAKIDINEIEGKQNILEEQNYINNLKLKISQKELFQQNIVEKLENLAEIEAKLMTNEEKLKELLEYDETINIAKEILEEAYMEMKESITPKFTENLSKSIGNITCGKYKSVKVNEENGLLLEAQNRKICNSKLFKWRNN